MNYFEHYSDLYFRFYDMDYYNQIRLYESKIETNDELCAEERFELGVGYITALFEIGRYQKFLTQVDYYIETVIEKNIYELNGEDVYKVLVFKKAAALYNLEKYKESKTIALQLSSMDKDNYLYKKLLVKSKVGNKKYFHKLAFRSYGVIFFGIAILLKILDLVLGQSHTLFLLNNVGMASEIAGVLGMAFLIYEYLQLTKESSIR